jgi:endo-1,4-beta-D-glucanase Y
LLAKEKVERTLLHHAAYSDTVQIFERIWNLAKEKMSTEKLNNFLLTQYYDRRTAWQVAAI